MTLFEDIRILCELPGVSGREEPVREYIISQLPEGISYETDALGNLFLSERMDIYRLTQIVDNCQFGMRISLRYFTLGLAELCPTTVHGCGLRSDGAWESRLLATVVIGQLHNDKWYFIIFPSVAPATH